LEDGDATLTEGDFWKVMQSIFHAKNYEAYKDGNWEDTRPIPYIPEIDGANIWEGGGQGIVPEGQ
jgi:hypothetical protein